MRLRAGAFSFDDSAAAPAVAFDVSALDLELKNLPLDGKQPMPTRLTARVAARKGEAGRIDYRGAVRADPLQAKGSVQAQQIPLHVFEPYFGDQLNIEIARADAGFKGDVDYADNGQGPVARVRGDIVLEDFRANSIAVRGGEAQLAQELLNWKALGLRGRAEGTASLEILGQLNPLAQPLALDIKGRVRETVSRSSKNRRTRCQVVTAR